MKIDFVIPASPTDSFYSQIAMARLGLDALGGVYRAAQVRVALGDEREREIDPRWLPYLDNVHFFWAPVEQFLREKYLAQVKHRFEIYRPDADVVIFCDADILIFRPFDDLLERHVKEPVFRGVIAHYPFPRRVPDDAERWRELSRSVIGREIPLDCEYTLEPGACPFYINNGFLMGTPGLFDRLAAVHEDVQQKVHVQLPRNYFSCQVALPLAVHKAEAPYETLPMRYNYPNDEECDARYPEELAKLTVMHYLREDHLKRHRLFASPFFFRRFLSKKLQGSNAALQERIVELTDDRYPFKR